MFRVQDSPLKHTHLRRLGRGLGHIQGTASHADRGGGGEGSGGADEKRGNSKLHLDTYVLMIWNGGSKNLLWRSDGEKPAMARDAIQREQGNEG